MPYQKTLFSRVPILEQHSKPVTYCAVLKSMARNTNNQVRITFTTFGSKMRTALHTWLALDTHVFTYVFTACSICGPKCPALFGTTSKKKISSYFGSERGKTIDKKEGKTENEFTHEEESRGKNDAQLSNSKPCNFQTKWLNDHKIA